MADRPPLVAVDAVLPPVAGQPGLVQGRYGANGNLELVVPAADDGLWVFWFNNDTGGREAGARPVCWSRGLRFATGRCYTGATIVQSRHGPDWLEVLATGDGLLHHYTWRPEGGFTAEGRRVEASAPPSAAEPADGVLRVVTPRDDGLLLRSAAPGGDWRSQLLALGHVAFGLLVATAEGLIAVWCTGTEVRAAQVCGGDHERTDEASWLAGDIAIRALGAAYDSSTSRIWLAWAEGSAISVTSTGPDLRPGGVSPAPALPAPPEALAIAVSKVGLRRTLELVARAGEVLYHARGVMSGEPGAIDWSAPVLIRSQVWAYSRSGVVHRG